MQFEDLIKLIETESAAIEFALNWKLLPEKHVICPVCQVGNVGWYKRSHEGLKIPYALRCSRKKCRKKWSVTKNTWFFGSHLTVKQNILLIYCWIRGDTVCETSGTLNLSKSTVVDYYQFCREVCYTIVSNRTRPIGGYGEVVSLCNFQVSRFRDKQKRNIYFIEGFNHRTDDCFLLEVHSRDPATWVYLIKRFILPGTTVLVDDFSEFPKIIDHELEFLKVGIKFVDNNDEMTVSSPPLKSLEGSEKQSEDEDKESQSRDYLLFQYLYFHPIEMLSIGEKFHKFLSDVTKVYPGPFKTSLKPIIY